MTSEKKNKMNKMLRRLGFRRPADVSRCQEIDKDPKNIDTNITSTTDKAKSVEAAKEFFVNSFSSLSERETREGRSPTNTDDDICYSL